MDVNGFLDIEQIKDKSTDNWTSPKLKCCVCQRTLYTTLKGNSKNGRTHL